jgi:hypothetical protein
MISRKIASLRQVQRWRLIATRRLLVKHVVIQIDEPGNVGSANHNNKQSLYLSLWMSVLENLDPQELSSPSILLISPCPFRSSTVENLFPFNRVNSSVRGVSLC